MSETESRLAVVIDSTGAEKNAVNLTTALQGLTEWGQKAAASANKVTKSSEEEKVALEKLKTAIDPVGAAINTVGRRFSELKKYFDKGLIDKEEFDFLTKKLNETTEELSGVAQAQREAEKAGRAAAAQQQAQARAFDAMLAKIDPLAASLKSLDQQQRALAEAATGGRLNLEEFDAYSAKLAEARRELTGEAQAERDAEKAHKAQIAALQATLDKLDPLAAALKNLEAQQRTLSDALSSGKINAEQYDNYSKKLAEARREVTGEAKAEREAVKAHEEQRAALQRLVAQLDPVSESFRRLEQQQKQLDKARSTGLLSTDSYSKLSGTLSEMRRVGEITNSTGKNGNERQTNRVGHAHDTGTDDGYCSRPLNGSVSVHGSDAAGWSAQRHVWRCWSRHKGCGELRCRIGQSGYSGRCCCWCVGAGILQRPAGAGSF